MDSLLKLGLGHCAVGSVGKERSLTKFSNLLNMVSSELEAGPYLKGHA